MAKEVWIVFNGSLENGFTFYGPYMKDRAECEQDSLYGNFKIDTQLVECRPLKRTRHEIAMHKKYPALEAAAEAVREAVRKYEVLWELCEAEERNRPPAQFPRQ